MATPNDIPHRAIENLLYEWARTIDEDRLEQLAGLMLPSATYKVTSRFNADRGLPSAVIDCRSSDQLQDRITSMRVANVYEKHFYRHVVSGVQVVGGREAAGWEVRANYLIVKTMEHDGSITVFSSGQYRDRVVLDGGEPKFASRLVVYDSRMIDTVLVTPI